MECFRLEVGHNHSVKIKNIVGAIANESGLDSQYIGRVNIYDDYSEIELPEGMPKDVFKVLKKVWVSGQQLKISAIKKDHKSAYSATNSKEKNTIITSLIAAFSTTSPRSTYPEGKLHLPKCGSMSRLTNKMELFLMINTTTATFGSR